MRDSDRRTRQITSVQHGLITARQAHGVGLRANHVAHRIDAGELHWMTPRVLALVGSPATHLQQLLTRVLDAGDAAGLSHTSCLAHWGVRGFVHERPHVIRHRDAGDHPVRGAILHEVRYLPWDLVRILDGIPVVSPALGLLQVAGMRSMSDRRLGRAIDAAWADRLVSYQSLTAVDRRMSRQGRSGLVRFRELVELRGPTYVPPASNLEGRFAQILRDAGLAPFVRQVDCSADEGWIGRVDFRDESLPLVVEIQSERFHGGLIPSRDDEARFDRLRQAGLDVLAITEEDIFHRSADVVMCVNEARHRARGRRAA